MKLQESGEMYLESIYLLSKKCPNVRSVDVAVFTGYSKPSVSRAMGLLRNANMIQIDPDGYISLTQEGLAVAERMYERHTAITEFFVNIGVPEGIASQDACKIEHVISETSFCALKDLGKKLKS